MTYKLKNVITFIFFLTLIYLIIYNSKIVTYSVISSANIFFYKLFPSLIPFFILSEFLINYDFTYNINIIISRILTFLFKINPNSSYIIILSLFSGLPSNAKFINDAYKDKVINSDEANKLLAFTFFPNPLFIINTIGTIIFNSFQIGIKILLSIYLSNFILGFIIRNKYISKDSNKIIKKQKSQFSETLKKSITNAFSSSMIILGSIVVFTTLYNLFLPILPFNNLTNSIILSFIEMTSGINTLASLNITNNLKIILISASICFSGLCVLSQAKSMLEFKINTKFIIMCRIIVIVINVIILKLII